MTFTIPCYVEACTLNGQYFKVEPDTANDAAQFLTFVHYAAEEGELHWWRMNAGLERIEWRVGWEKPKYERGWTIKEDKRGNNVGLDQD